LDDTRVGFLAALLRFGGEVRDLEQPGGLVLGHLLEPDAVDPLFRAFVPESLGILEHLGGAPARDPDDQRQHPGDHEQHRGHAAAVREELAEVGIDSVTEGMRHGRWIPVADECGERSGRARSARHLQHASAL
jgi:hypothetical protein